MSKRSKSPSLQKKDVRLDWTLITDPVKLTGKEILWAGEPEGGEWHSMDQALLLVLSEKHYCVIDTDLQELLRYESPDGTPRLDELLSPRVLQEIGAVSERQREQMEAWNSAQKIEKLRVGVETLKRVLEADERKLAELEAQS
jgi:hypothetical protein